MGIPEKRLNAIYAAEFANYRVTPNGIQARGRSKDFDTKIRETFVDLIAEFPDATPREFRESIIDRIEDVPPQTDRGCIDRDKAVDEFLAERDIHISADGKEITMGPHTDLSPVDLKDSFKDWAAERNQGLTREDTQYSGELLYVRFAQRLQQMGVQEWTDIMTRLEYCPEAAKKLPANLEKMLLAIRVNPDDRDKLNADRRMLAHFMWTVKRRILLKDFNPSLPLCVVFQGRQQGGKTSFIENHFGSVFRRKVVSADLSVIHDSREFKKWVDNAIVNFDELSIRGLTGGKRSTLELLKQLLTSSHSQERTFHTQTQQTYRIRASFCATTNKHLAESLSDPTGMRRYWSIYCDTDEETPGFNWDVLESFPWLELWKGVDEHKRGGYIDTTHKLYPVIQAEQDSYCIQPSLRRWFEEHYEIFQHRDLHGKTAQDVKADDQWKEAGIRALSPLNLYGDYADTMRELNNFAVSQGNFIGMLCKMGVRQIPRSRTHARQLYFVVKPH